MKSSRLLAFLLALFALSAYVHAAPPQKGRALFLPTGAGSARAMASVDSIELGKMRVVNDLSGLPAPVAGVITIDSATTNVVLVTKPINISPNMIRLTGGGIVDLYGPGSITSTAAYVLEVTGDTSSHLNQIELLNSVSGGLRIANTPGLGKIDIYGANIVTPNGVGVRAEGALSLGINTAFVEGAQGIWASDVAIIGLSQIAIIGPSVATGLRLDGTMGVTAIVDIDAFAFDSGAMGAVGWNINITGGAPRFAARGCSFVVPLGSTGILSTTGSFMAPRGFLLSNTSFSGAGTTISGVTANTAQANFNGNSGIANSAPRGAVYWTSSVLTTITTSGTYYKVEGGCTVQANATQLMTSDGTCRVTNVSGATLTCSVIGQTGGTTSTPTGNYAMRIFLDGVTAQQPVGNSRALNSNLATITTFGTVTIPNNSFVEMFITKDTSGTTYTATSGTLVVTGCVYS